VAKNSDFAGAKEGFVSRECTTTVFHLLNNSIEVLEVFPNESAYTWVFGNGFIVKIGKGKFQN
jgi:hypothetical protein